MGTECAIIFFICCMWCFCVLVFSTQFWYILFLIYHMYTHSSINLYIFLTLSPRESWNHNEHIFRWHSVRCLSWPCLRAVRLIFCFDETVINTFHFSKIDSHDGWQGLCSFEHCLCPGFKWQVWSLKEWSFSSVFIFQPLRMYEKRKAAALEIEKMVKDFVSVGNTSQIKKLLKVPQQIQKKECKYK